MHPYFEVQEKCTTFEAEPVRENFARVHPNINAKIQKNTQNTAAKKRKIQYLNKNINGEKKINFGTGELALSTLHRDDK